MPVWAPCNWYPRGSLALIVGLGLEQPRASVGITEGEGGRPPAAMRVTVHFADGERIEGASEAVTLTKVGFPIVPDSGNNELVWVSLTAIKYVSVHGAVVHADRDSDPRADQGLQKVVIRFHDGEVIRTYRDESWRQEGEGFKLRVWDAPTGRLTPTLLSLHSVKGIFFVREWDSRSVEEKLLRHPRFSGGSPGSGSHFRGRELQGQGSRPAGRDEDFLK
jgi:hypothetical protein